MDQGIRHQINWVIMIGAIACLIVWGIGSSQRMNLLREKIATGAPAEQLTAVQQLVDSRLLADAVKDQPRWIQDRVVASIGTIGTSQAWYQLLSAWKLLDAPVQARATSLLIDAGPTAIPTLVEALQAKDANTRAGVNAVLIGIGEPCIPYLMPLLDAWDDYVRAGASAILGGIGEPALDEVIAVAQKVAPSGGQDADAFLRERAAVQAALKAMNATAFDAIISELLTHENADIRGIGTALLGSIADQIAGTLPPEDAVRVIQPLLGRLQGDSSYAVRRKAAFALGQLGQVGIDNGVVAPLVAKLQSTSEQVDVRAATAEALGKLDDPSAAAPLVAVLMTNQAQIADEIVGALERLGAPAVPSIARAIKSPTSAVQRLAVRALSNIGGPAPVNLFGVALSSNSPEVRRAAAEALRARAANDLRTNASTIVGPLARALSDADWHVYNAARDALGKTGPVAVPVLLPVLGHGDARAAHMAQEALTRIGTEAIPGLISIIKSASTNPEGAAWAALALGGLGHDAVPAIARIVDDTTQSMNVRKAAVVALGNTASPDAMTYLSKAYTGTRPDLDTAIIVAVAAIGTEDGTAVALKGLQSSSPTIRDAAMDVLGKWRTGTTSAELTKLLTSADTDVAYRAAIALVAQAATGTDALLSPMGSTYEASIDDATADKAGKLLQQAAENAATAPSVRHKAVQALGYIGRPEALTTLGRLLEAGGDYAADAAQSVAWIGIANASEETDIARTAEELSEAGKLLIEILLNPKAKDPLRLQAAVALSMMQMGPVKALLAELKGAPDTTGMWIAATLGAAGRHATDDVVETRRLSQDTNERAWLAIAMKCIDDDKSLREFDHITDQEKPDPAKLSKTLELTKKIRLQKK